MSKIAFVFPGQGSQYVGMGKSIFDNFKTAREVFEEANDSLGFDLKRLCFEESLEELSKTENTQPAILTTSFAAFKVFMQEVGIHPDLCAGHSLGEITALACSGAIEFSDAVKIVRQRGKFMQEASAMGMGVMEAISGVDVTVIQKECEKASTADNIAVVSNYNAPDQTVISGNKNAVHNVCESLKNMGAIAVPLKVSAPFHSPIMKSAALKLEGELKNYNFLDMKYTVISNVDAKPYQNIGEIVDRLKNQMVMPVQWQETIRYFVAQGIDTAIEIGPKNVLKKLMTKNAESIKVYACEKDNEILELKNNFVMDTQANKGARFDTTVVTKCLAVAVCTKNNNWDKKEYEEGVVIPYKKIKKMQEALEQEGRQPSMEEMTLALEMLQSVFKVKKVPMEEKVRRFEQIFEQTGTRNLFASFKVL